MSVSTSPVANWISISTKKKKKKIVTLKPEVLRENTQNLALSPQMHDCDGHIDMQPGPESVWGLCINLQTRIHSSAVSLLGKMKKNNSKIFKAIKSYV